MASRKKEETEKALRLCDKRCVICGWSCTSLNGEPLVEGAHIKPVSELEKDSFDDIIALCPNHHAEFDAYKFYIKPKTRVLVHIDKHADYYGQVIDVPYVKDEYLAYRQYLAQTVQEKYLLATV